MDPLGLGGTDPFVDQLAGDFYNNSNNVTRGAPMAMSSMGTTGFAGTCDFYGGDFSFVDADDYFKDKSLPLQRDSGFPGAMFDYSKEQLSGKMDVSVEERFSDTNVVPDVPRDSFFVFAPTTLRIVFENGKGSPSGIGNAIIDFFEDEVESTILKIRPKKFWVAANVFVEGKMVRVKARVYKETNELFPVEFQRRTGDVVSFVQIYRKVLQFMSKKGYQLEGVVDRGADQKLEDSPSYSGEPPPLPPLGADAFDFAPPPIPSLLPHGDKEFGDFAAPPHMLGQGFPGQDIAFAQENPLIGMMLIRDIPSIQAEAFNSLADLARDKGRGFQTSGLGANEQFVKNVTYLLTGPFPNDPEAEYAFVRLLAQAACDPEVIQGFAKGGALMALADKVWHKTVSAIAKKEIASALVQAAKHLKESTKEGMDKLAKDLEEAIAESRGSALQIDKRVKDLLAEARKCLSSV